MVSQRVAVASGMVSAAFGLALGELAAAVLNPDASPLIVVGSQVIDLTPTAAKEWAIATFGTADKPILIAGVGSIVLAISALGGWLASRRMVWGGLIFAALGAVAGAIALLRSGSLVDILPAAAATLGALASLLLLIGNRSGTPQDGNEGRRFLLRAVLVLIAAGASESLSRHLVGRAGTRRSFTLPQPRRPISSLPRGLDLPGITPFRTSTRDFYRVDTRLTLPSVDLETWRLRIDGRVGRTVVLDFDRLAAMELIERDITLTCVSNDVGGRYVGGARWLGVRLTDLLELADVGRGADQILSTDVDGMTISTPLAVAVDGRDSMIAIGMNGQPLSPEHGFPARLVVPGLYGFVGATKWITRMTLTTYAEQDAYWTKRGWAIDAPIKPSSRIDTPRPFQSLRAGDDITIGGMAWAQASGGIADVEVSIDDGPWRAAVLGPTGGADYWRQWYLTWRVTSGEHTIAVRAIAADGTAQSAERATPFPDGSSGIQRLAITVE